MTNTFHHYSSSLRRRKTFSTTKERILPKLGCITNRKYIQINNCTKWPKGVQYGPIHIPYISTLNLTHMFIYFPVISNKALNGSYNCMRKLAKHIDLIKLYYLICHSIHRYITHLMKRIETDFNAKRHALNITYFRRVQIQMLKVKDEECAAPQPSWASD